MSEDNYGYGCKGFGCVVMFVSGVALFFSFWAFLKWDKPAADLNAYGVLIAAIGVIVTFVVAWQIWQTIASRDEIKEAREAADKANRVAREVSLLNDEFKESLNLFAAYGASSDGLSFLLNNRHFKAFHLFATAIIDSLNFINDKGRCAMGALVNLDNCMSFDENDASKEDFKENWDGVVARLKEIEDALRNADQENKIFQAMARHHIDEFKKAARAKGFEI